MRFEISYQGGTTHEVELPGSVCVVGRDPACDIVLNDSKCSRRHAVIEDGPSGLSIRDSGSANGIFVNGRKVEKAPLNPGDSVKLGEVTLRLLPEIGETVIVAPEGLELAPEPFPPLVGPPPGPPASAPGPQGGAPPPAPAAAARPARRGGASAVPAPRPPRREPQDLGRPATVSLLAGLWALFVPLAGAGVLLAAARFQAGWPGWLAAGLLAAVCAVLGTSMALGLRALAPWARHLQIAIAALGLVACPFTLAAATVLLYMTRPEVKAAFDGTTPALGTPADSAEPTFALSLVGLLLLGLALTAIAVLVF